MDIEAMNRHMSALMEVEGLPYSPRTHTYNSRLAQELGKWADTQPGGEALHEALYIAYFVEGRNISARKVLIDVTQSVGLSVKAAQEVFDERLFRQEVDTDWARSRREATSGVPTFVIGGYTLVGAQPYDALEQLVRKASAVLRTKQRDK